jgi:hypothetical protein
LVENLFPVVPDTGTLKAARLASEVTGNPGRWVRLDCQHLRHVQQPVEVGQLLECPHCPPSIAGGLPSHRVLRHTDAPVELTVDAGEDVVHIQVRDDHPALSGNGRVVSFELRQA